MQSHEEVVNTFMKKIYRGALKPDARLPTEKRLAEELELDRGALRIGLRQLESMGVIRIRHGDGMYVRDYMKSAGLDFLKTLFMVREAKGEDPVIDDYLIDEIWEFWIMLFPAVVEMAAVKLSSRDMRALTGLLDEELENISDRDKVIELEVLSHDLIVNMADNTILTLLFNSCLPFRQRIVSLQIRDMTREELTEHIESKRALVAYFMTSGPSDMDAVIKTFTQRMENYRSKLRRKAFGADRANQREGGSR